MVWFFWFLLVSLPKHNGFRSLCPDLWIRRFRPSLRDMSSVIAIAYRINDLGGVYPDRWIWRFRQPFRKNITVFEIVEITSSDLVRKIMGLHMIVIILLRRLVKLKVLPHPRVLHSFFWDQERCMQKVALGPRSSLIGAHWFGAPVRPSLPSAKQGFMYVGCEGSWQWDIFLHRQHHKFFRA